MGCRVLYNIEIAIARAYFRVFEYRFAFLSRYPPMLFSK